MHEFSLWLCCRSVRACGQALQPFKLTGSPSVRAAPRTLIGVQGRQLGRDFQPDRARRAGRHGAVEHVEGRIHVAEPGKRGRIAQRELLPARH